MKKSILGMATLGLGLALAAGSPASAREGCGAGWHRAAHGRCVLNRRAVVRAPIAPVLVVHRYYAGRGYWDGHRFWQHRDRWHNRWRYR